MRLVYLNGLPIAAVSNRLTYYVRTDHIGRQAFATNDSGAVVWDASYKPFGEVNASTGAPINLRFPGQWFSSESDLSQNWMRDYDPTLGRYIQADPLGLVDGASVYGYARQSPNRYTDFSGLFTFQDAVSSLYGKNRSKYYDSGFTQEEIFNEWLDLERKRGNGWTKDLPACPCNMDNLDFKIWTPLEPASQIFHKGGKWATRTREPLSDNQGAQCVFGANGQFIPNGVAAGTADLFSPVGITNTARHYFHDVQPWYAARDLGRINDYNSVRPSGPER